MRDIDWIPLIPWVVKVTRALMILNEMCNSRLGEEVLFYLFVWFGYTYFLIKSDSSVRIV